ncbi:aminotransferase class I/II-fold pyridoxal phosphate-dependent enzyme, partial [bacterium]|nr:aminotransferase class I/II-fold pyridoxal phosphate-dependent enzyme [bacterium]
MKIRWGPPPRPSKPSAKGSNSPTSIPTAPDSPCVTPSPKTQPGKGRVLASAYAFAVYGLMARLFGIPFEEVPDRDFHHDLAGFSARLGDDVRLVFLASPNNPTGTRIPNTELKAFVEKFPAGPLLVLDEAYYEFIS